jgi:hypothetical protein
VSELHTEAVIDPRHGSCQGLKLILLEKGKPGVLFDQCVAGAGRLTPFLRSAILLRASLTASFRCSRTGPSTPSLANGSGLGCP